MTLFIAFITFVACIGIHPDQVRKKKLFGKIPVMFIIHGIGWGIPLFCSFIPLFAGKYKYIDLSLWLVDST